MTSVLVCLRARVCSFVRGAVGLAWPKPVFEVPPALLSKQLYPLAGTGDGAGVVQLLKVEQRHPGGPVPWFAQVPLCALKAEAEVVGKGVLGRGCDLGYEPLAPVSARTCVCPPP